jgi:hypothetical protein
MIKLIQKYDITTYIDYDDFLNYLKESNKQFKDINDAIKLYMNNKNSLKIDEKKIDSILDIDEDSKKMEELNFYLKLGKYNL